jgi:hypothetical protein
MRSRWKSVAVRKGELKRADGCSSYMPLLWLILLAVPARSNGGVGLVD